MGEYSDVTNDEESRYMFLCCRPRLNRPVLDKTGLAGRYDFTLEFNLRVSPIPPDPAAANDLASDPGPDVGAALQQQLGLRLVAGKAKLDVVVLDKAERLPTAN